MAPHLSHAEQDLLFAAYASGKTPAEKFSVLQKRRLREGAPMVNITVVRRFLHGKTHKRGRPGAHGRKRSLSRRNVLALRVCAAGEGALHAHCTLIARSLHGTLHGTLHGGKLWAKHKFRQNQRKGEGREGSFCFVAFCCFAPGFPTVQCTVQCTVQ